MELSAPKTITFLIAIVIAVLAALEAQGIIHVIPIASVWVMGIAFVVLALGCLLKGV